MVQGQSCLPGVAKEQSRLPLVYIIDFGAMSDDIIID
jgi:hypothetical protein